MPQPTEVPRFRMRVTSSETSLQMLWSRVPKDSAEDSVDWSERETTEAGNAVFRQELAALTTGEWSSSEVGDRLAITLVAVHEGTRIRPKQGLARAAAMVGALRVCTAPAGQARNAAVAAVVAGSMPLHLPGVFRADIDHDQDGSFLVMRDASQGGLASVQGFACWDDDKPLLVVEVVGEERCDGAVSRWLMAACPEHGWQRQPVLSGPQRRTSFHAWQPRTPHHETPASGAPSATAKGARFGAERILSRLPMPVGASKETVLPQRAGHRSVWAGTPATMAWASGLVSHGLRAVGLDVNARDLVGRDAPLFGRVAENVVRLQVLDRMMSALTLRSLTFAEHATDDNLTFDVCDASSQIIAREVLEELVERTSRIVGAEMLGARKPQKGKQERVLADHPVRKLQRDSVMIDMVAADREESLELVSEALLHVSRAADDDGLRGGWQERAESLVSFYREGANAETFPVSVAHHLFLLAGMTGDRRHQALAMVGEALLAAVRAGGMIGALNEPGLRADASRIAARLDAMSAYLVWNDPQLRRLCGMPSIEGDPGFEENLRCFAIGWLGGGVVADLRALSLRVGLQQGWLPAQIQSKGGLTGLEARLYEGFAEARCGLLGEPRGDAGASGGNPSDSATSFLGRQR